MKPESSQTFQQAIKHIQQDNTSGSIELAKQSAELLQTYAHMIESKKDLHKATHLLINAQPAMAAIITLVNNLLIHIDQHRKQPIQNSIQTVCTAFLNNLKTTDALISKQATQLIPDPATIITHSYSSTILKTLFAANQSRKHLTVICTESRPKNEGILLTKKLARKNISVKLIVDAAVFYFIPKADIILIGSDAIITDGLINKIGTSGIALSAHEHHIPIYTLCSTIKFLPPAYPYSFHQMKKSTEIMKTNIPHIFPKNFYFDTTPLKYLNGIITENSIHKPSEIQKMIKQIPFHPSLLDENLRISNTNTSLVTQEAYEKNEDV